jgi:putative SOS response-associated peptidase YedK
LECKQISFQRSPIGRVIAGGEEWQQQVSAPLRAVTALGCLRTNLVRSEILCGRLDQNDVGRLLQNFAWPEEVFNRSQAEAKFNVAPGTFRPVIHVEAGDLFIDDLHWGYRSSWAEASGKIPVAINTRLEKITNRYWKPLLTKGRAVVPAAGWYEWTGKKGQKQPWHIHRADREPLYLAALAKFNPDTEIKTSNGFTIVTADSQGGMVDVHDRRPVVLTQEDAAVWLDPAMSAEQAEQFVRSVALGPESFDWYMVDRAVGNVRNQGPELAIPIDNDR